ncbi:hypothetical protein SO802_015173 [Lithocarpus litseifolius]|uniref:Uncharacterized protein n=1 Tax=Lithocarpus litseifolius TaxID=425828 RepID=A0AAW2CTJ8_9ROSI
MNLIESEDLVWGCFEKAVSDEDIAACYGMSLKDFEHSWVHDLFKEVKDECKRWAEVVAKSKDEVRELQNHVEELKADIIEKDTRLDHLQKRNDELSTLLEKARGDVVAEFKASKQYTDLLDANYAAGFEDFRMDAMENFPELDFSSVKLNLGGATTSSLLQTSSEDVNIEDDATTQPN